MTPDHPDHWAGNRALRVVPEPDPTVERARERERTDLESIAAWIASLTYGDMKKLAAGILAKDDEAETIVLADRLHVWADKTRVPV